MKKFPPGQLALAGLVKARETGNGFYDTFRNRLMFPIRDESGRIIAFGGRVMPGSQDPAKYLNSPETPLFSKSRAVYGLDLARQKIVETRMDAGTVLRNARSGRPRVSYSVETMSTAPAMNVRLEPRPV